MAHLPDVLRLALLGALLVLAGCRGELIGDGFTEREERRFAVTGRPEVTLATENGSVEVRSWDRDEVVVAIDKRGSSEAAVRAIRIEAGQDGSRIRISVEIPRRGEAFLGTGGASARLIATIPRESDLTVATGDGGVSVEHLDGRLELRTGDGAIRGFELRGEVQASTGDGSLRLEGIDGLADLTTGDGSVNVSGRLTGVRIQTGDGAIVLRAQEGSWMERDWSVRTGDGGVVLYLPADFHAQLEAETSDGDIRTDGGLLRDSRGGRRHLSGSIGDGGRTLQIRTGDGPISVRSS